MAERKISIRPFARLLTMLGSQLIKNEQIAVIELIKNSYDADADWVKVSFEGFTSSFGIMPDSKIVIEDNGCGMTADKIEKSWMSPATPSKLPKNGKIVKTDKYGRVIQGEKGIGRYAMLKLGKTINMTTRPSDWLKNDEGNLEQNNEYNICLDFNSYDDDFIKDAKEGGMGLFLDELGFILREQKPSVFIERNITVGNQKFPPKSNVHGTRIEISNLLGVWSQQKIKPIKESFVRFQDLFNEITKSDEAEHKDFSIGLYLNGEPLIQEGASEDNTLRNLLENKSVLRITNGCYFSKEGKFTYTQNGSPKELSAKDDATFRGIRFFRETFKDKEKNRYRDISDFGDFEFDLYIFDLNTKDVNSKYFIPPEARDVIKNHRIYLLRDNIRVLPYGDPDDDWLQIEVRRGKIRAGDFFSNDQVVGRIKITKFDNPHLKDKTNREGLIEDENYTTDFICIIQTFLSYLRQEAYAKYIDENKKRNKIDQVRKEAVVQEIDKLGKLIENNKPAMSSLQQLKKAYDIERKYLYQRVDQTESLAAVGLSVETTSHDLMMMLNKGVDELFELYKGVKSPNFDMGTLEGELEKLQGIFSYVQHQMKDIQMLFTSSKQRRRPMKVKDILDKVMSIYKRTLNKHKIDYEVDVIGSPLMAKCTDADLLQLFINLLDNSIYWLDEEKDKKIIVTLDGSKSKLIFSDNGPGIKNENIPYIFEPFYSTKGENGRGLGLYISRRLMENNDYSIELVDLHSEKVLKGANFVVYFIKNEEQ